MERNMHMHEAMWALFSTLLLRNGPLLSHLFFADDQLIFEEASEDQMKVIMECVAQFCESSGQRMNIKKSSIYVSQKTCNTPNYTITVL